MPPSQDPSWRQLGLPATGVCESKQDRALPPPCSQGSLAPEQGAGQTKTPGNVESNHRAVSTVRIPLENNRVFAHARDVSGWKFLLEKFSSIGPRGKINNTDLTDHWLATEASHKSVGMGAAPGSRLGSGVLFIEATLLCVLSALVTT